MGSGKTTIGKALSERKNVPFIDCDRYLEEQENQTISDMFKSKGESYFREKESEFLCTLVLTKPSVISTGGGCVTVSQNNIMLKKLGYVIYLHCDLPILTERLSFQRHKRPLLTGDDYKNDLKQLFEKRVPLYRTVADLEVDTTSESIDSLVTKVMNAFDK